MNAYMKISLLAQDKNENSLYLYRRLIGRNVKENNENEERRMSLCKYVPQRNEKSVIKGNIKARNLCKGAADIEIIGMASLGKAAAAKACIE